MAILRANSPFPSIHDPHCFLFYIFFCDSRFCAFEISSWQKLRFKMNSFWQVPTRHSRIRLLLHHQMIVLMFQKKLLLNCKTSLMMMLSTASNETVQQNQHVTMSWQIQTCKNRAWIWNPVSNFCQGWSIEHWLSNAEFKLWVSKALSIPTVLGVPLLKVTRICLSSVRWSIRHVCLCSHSALSLWLIPNTQLPSCCCSLRCYHLRCKSRTRLLWIMYTSLWFPKHSFFSSGVVSQSFSSVTCWLNIYSDAQK